MSFWWFNQGSSGPAPFVPTDIPNCVLWLEAEDVNGDGSTPSDGVDYDTWVDKSGLGNDATAIVGEEPTFDAASLNGLGGLDFDGLVDYMNTGAISQLNNPAGLTVYMVVTFQGSFGLDYMCMFDYPEDSQTAGLYRSSGTHVFFGTNSSGSTVLSQKSGGETPAYIGGIWDMSTDVPVVRVNGVAGGAASSATATPTTHSDFHIGGSDTGSTTWPGLIHEVVVFSRNIDGSEITQLESYFATKYAI